MPRQLTLSEAIESYASHLRARDLANNTIKNATQVLRRAVREWGDIQVGSIRPVHIDRLFSNGGWGPSTRNLYLGNLRQFFEWCRHHGYMARDFDPAFGWRNVRVPNTPKLRLPVEEFYPLMDACEHPRDRAAVALGLFTFCRGSEIQTIRLNDLDLGNLTLEIYRRKTHQYDTLPVCEELRQEMVRWLNWYRQDQGELMGNWFLVPSKKSPTFTWVDGQPVPTEMPGNLRPTQMVGHPYEAVKRPLAAMGYDTEGEGNHTLRRSGARALADRLRGEGVDSALLRVASMLGHRDVRVTQVYIGWDLERDQRNAMLQGERMFPQVEQTQTLRVVDNG